MPVVTCPHCRSVSQLPDPWYAPGFTCHHCRQPVTISHPAAPIPDPFADLASVRPVVSTEPAERTDRREGRRAFWWSFGSTMGEHAANAIAGLFVLLLLAVGFYFLWPHVSFLFNWMRK